MKQSTDDLRIIGTRPLLPPAILMEELPVSDSASDCVTSTRAALESVLSGADDRLIVVVGPCSIHDPVAAVDYAQRLLTVRERYAENLLIVMRVYFEKPRSTVGWKGLINDPHLDGSFDINRGLRMARRLLLELADMGLPAGCEFLDTITPQFIADLVAWGAIGARTTESQIHRELASGLSMPVGFKNGTDGSIAIAVDAISAAAHGHHFLSVTKQGLSAIVTTAGNPHCHLILRGSNQGPNYSADDIDASVSQLTRRGLTPRVMVDCSHGNSQKDHRKQAGVAAEVAEQIRSGSQAVAGVMLESNLHEGRQDKPERYGVSITDACIGWETTEELCAQLAAAVAARRRALAPQSSGARVSALDASLDRSAV